MSLLNNVISAVTGTTTQAPQAPVAQPTVAQLPSNVAHSVEDTKVISDKALRAFGMGYGTADLLCGALDRVESVAVGTKDATVAFSSGFRYRMAQRSGNQLDIDPSNQAIALRSLEASKARGKSNKNLNKARALYAQRHGITV